MDLYRQSKLISVGLIHTFIRYIYQYLFVKAVHGTYLIWPIDDVLNCNWLKLYLTRAIASYV